MCAGLHNLGWAQICGLTLTLRRDSLRISAWLYPFRLSSHYDYIFDFNMYNLILVHKKRSSQGIIIVLSIYHENPKLKC